MAEQHQNYMNGTNGPFKCSNCSYFVADSNECEQENIIEFAQENKFGLIMSKSGNAKVDPEGCSDYFEPQSLLDEPIDDESEPDEEDYQS